VQKGPRLGQDWPQEASIEADTEGMSIPKWKKLEAGHYQLDNGEYIVSKGAPDWSVNDGRFPSTEWHLIDKNHALIESGSSGTQLMWSITYKYLTGKLGGPQPIVKREFKMAREIDLSVELKALSARGLSEADYAAALETKRSQERDFALKGMTRDPEEIRWAFSKRELIDVQHIVDGDKEYIVRHYRVETHLPYWEYAWKAMKRRQGTFNNYKSKLTSYTLV
jgi:hypothetical protein